MTNVKVATRSMEELKRMRSEIDDEIRNLERKEREKPKSKEVVIKEFDGFGIVIPTGTKFWRISGEHRNDYSLYGMEIGGYTHSCHIDTTDIKVLLVVDGIKTYVKEYAEIWLTEAFVS